MSSKHGFYEGNLHCCMKFCSLFAFMLLEYRGNVQNNQNEIRFCRVFHLNILEWKELTRRCQSWEVV